jgi:hypothetical protein
MCPCTTMCLCLRTAINVSAYYDTRANARLRRQACCYAKSGMRRHLCESRYAKAGMRRQVCEGIYAKAGMRRQVCGYVCVLVLLCMCPHATATYMRQQNSRGMTARRAGQFAGGPRQPVANSTHGSPPPPPPPPPPTTTTPPEPPPTPSSRTPSSG